MKETGATQLEVATAAAVTQPTVSRWLEGQIPKADDLYRLAVFFNRAMDWFLGAEEKTPIGWDPSEPMPEHPTLEQFHAMAESAKANAEAVRVGAERFGRLPQMVPRIQALEREAGSLRKMIEEMIAAGYTPKKDRPTDLHSVPEKVNPNSVEPHILEAADREQRNAERSILRRRTKGGTKKT